MPDDFRDALIVALYKNKGSKSDCGNYRGISLLSVAGKIFARILLNRLITVSERSLPEAQCGFRPGRSTVDMIFVVRQVQEKCIEQNKALYSVFIDLTKAFDTITGEALWTVLERDGCPKKFVRLIRLLHDGMTRQVLCSGDQSAAFSITNGVKQGYDSDLQMMLNKFSVASKAFGLTISISKTEVLHQPAPNTTPVEPNICIDDTPLANVDSFKYLGSIISNDGSLDKEITSRISKASQALGRLRTKVLNHHNICLSTKMKVYRAVVLTSLLYECETWTLYRSHVKQLAMGNFHIRVLRSILGIRWQDRITNLDWVLDRAECTSIEAILIKAQLRWVGHVMIRMDGHRMLRQLLYGELEAGKRKQGRPRKRYKDTVKGNLQWCGIHPKELEAAASDRSHWCSLTRTASTRFEDDRRQSLMAAYERRHRACSADITTTEFQCPTCSRLCASRLGLQSNQRIHR